MKGALFFFSFCCIFAVTDAIKCWVNEKGAAPELMSDCTACGYHNVISQCTTVSQEVERLCLNEILMEYADDNGNQRFDRVGECSVENKGCKHMVFICTTDECNINCGLSASTSFSPSTTTLHPSSIPSTSTSATTTTEVKNGGISSTVSFYLFGFFALIFSFMF